MIEALEERLLLATVNWISSTSGNWDVGSNWSTGQVPGPGDDVVISVPGDNPTITLNSGNQTIHSLQCTDTLAITGGSLGLVANSEIDGALTLGSGGEIVTDNVLTLTGSDSWTGGTISGDIVSLTSTATLAMSDATATTLSATLNNAGGISVTGGGGLVGGGTLNNTGTFSDNSTGTFTISLPFQNQGGTIDVASGTLSIQSTSCTWTGGGTLDAAAGATLQLAPASADDGIILSGTYTGSGAGAVEFTTGGLVTGQSGATFDFPQGLFSWQGGEIFVEGGALVNTGFLTLDNSGGITLAASAAPGDFVNQGEIDQTGAGNLVISSGTLDNQAQATYDISGTGGITGAGTFSVEGTVKMTSTGTATLAVFSALNGGTIDAASGTLSIQSVDSIWTGGTLDAAAGATLQLAPALGGDNGIRMTGTYTGSGGGVVELTTGGLEIGSSGATFDFPKGLFQWQGGSINVDLGGALTNTGFLTLSNSSGITLSTLSAPGDMVNKGEVDQTGTGNLAIPSGTFDNQAGATYDFSGTGGVTGAGAFSDEGTIEMTGSGVATISVSSALNGGTIDVDSGTLSIQSTNCTWTGGTLSAATGATLQLAPAAGGPNGITLTGTYSGSGGGTVELTSGALDIGSGGATLDFPQGLFQWQGGTLGGAFSGPGTLTNASTGFIGVNPGSGNSLAILTGGLAFGGTIDVESGTLLLEAPSVTGADGSFTVAQGATVNLDPVLVTYTGTFTGSGGGTVAIGGDGLLLIGDTGATFNFKGSLLQWTGGGTEDFSNGDLTNLGTINFAGTAAKVFGSGATLENEGTIIQTGTGNLELQDTNPAFPTILQNDAGALYEIEGDSGIIQSGQSAIDNAGTIEKTAGTGTSIIQADGTLTNTGTIEADSGTISLSATIAQVSSSTLTGGTWNALGGSTIQFPTGTSLTTNQASVTLSGAGAGILALTSLTSNTGSLTVTGGATLATAGNLSNTGTVTVGPASTLTVNGNYTQGSASTLDIQLGGSPASGQFGQVAVRGSAALGGTLQSELVNGYAPNTGDSFRIVSFASATGSFAATDTPLYHGGNLLQAVTNPTNIIFTAAASVANLVVTSVSASPNPVETAQNLTVNYSVRNTGNATAVSSWVDSVFLSSTGAITSSAVLLGRVTHTGAVAANGTYPGTLTAAVPAIAPGNYFIVVEVDSRGLVPDGNRSGTVLASPTTLLLTMPSLTVAAVGTTPTPATGTIETGQEPGYQTTPSPGSVVQITATTGSTDAAELLVGFDAIPTEGNSLAETLVPTASTQQLTFTAAEAGTYYVVLIGQSGAGDGTNFSLTAQQLPLILSTVSPTTGGNTGPVTLDISGGELAAADTFDLLGPGGVSIPGSVTQALSGSSVYATFDLAGAAVGTYDLQARAPAGQVAVLPGALTVKPGAAASLVTSVQVPSAQRVGRPVTGYVVYQNTGNVDMPAPLLILSSSSPDLELSLTGAPNLSSSPQYAMGVSPVGPAGILLPGEVAQIPLVEESTTATGSGPLAQTVQLTYETATSTDPVDYNALAVVRPDRLSDADWNTEWTYFQTEAGPTWGGLVHVLDRYATYLGQEGDPSTDSFQTVLGYALHDALALAEANATGTLFLGNAQVPLPNTEILLSNSTTGSSAGAVSEPDGTFAVGGLSAGTYNVQVVGYTLSSSLQVTIPTSGAVTGLSIVAAGPTSSITASTASATGSISGTVVSSIDQSNLSDVPVVATDTVDQSMYEATTDSFGDYQLSGLQDGAYDLAIGGGALETQYINNILISGGNSILGENVALAPSATLQGEIVANGAAVAGAFVGLTDADGNVISATTDSNGDFTIDGLSAGTYAESVVASGFAPSAATLALSAGATFAAPTVSLATGSTLTVSVVDTSSTAVADAIVELAQSGQPTTAMPVDAQGQATFSDLGAGIYEVEISAPDLKLLDTTITLAAGATLSQSYTLGPGDVVQGVVSDGNGSPIANIIVQLSGQDVAGTPYNLETATASDGSYSFTGLPDGTFIVSAGNLSGIDQQQATLTPSAPQSALNFSLAGSIITGQVFAADGATPVPSAQVFLVQNGQALVEANTDSGGNFTMRGLAAGSYTLLADTAQAVTQTETISVAADATASPLDLQSGSFLGAVVNMEGNPLADAAIVLAPAGISDLQVFFQAKSDVQGQFDIGGLAPGEYTLEIQAPGLADFTQAVTVSAGNAQRQTFALNSGLIVSGTVDDAATGDAVAQALATFYDPTTHNAVAEVIADGSGLFSLPLAPGTYNVLVSAPGYQMIESQGVAVAPGKAGLNFSLSAAATTLQGTVVDSNGLPLSGAEVDVVNTLGETIAALTTAQQGGYSVAGLAPGNYTIRTSLLGYYPSQPTSVTINPGATGAPTLALVAAGTDEIPSPQSFNNASAYQAYLNDLEAALKAGGSQPHPLPGDPSLTGPPPAAGPCAEAQVARQVLLAAANNVAAAYDAWAQAYANYEETEDTSIGITGLDTLNLIASIYGAFASGGLGEAAQLNSLRSLNLYTSAGTAGLVGTELANLGSLGPAVKSYMSGVTLPTDFASTVGFMNGLASVVAGVLGSAASIPAIIAALAGNKAALGNGLNVSGAGPVLNLITTLLDAFQSWKAFEGAQNTLNSAPLNYVQALLLYKQKLNAFLAANNCPPGSHPPVPPGHPSAGPSAGIHSIQARDPNNITGPAGFGTQGFIQPIGPLLYTIDFTNESSASAPAATVAVTEHLSSNLNLSTFQLGQIGFGSTVVQVPAGLTSYSTEVTLPSTANGAGPDGLIIDISAALNPATGLVTWTFTSLDPTTLDVPINPLEGFLPPDDSEGDGEGFVSYTIQPKSGPTTGTVINAQATVVFDTNEPISTTVISNTIDETVPTSAVKPLPATTSSPSFTVSWSGSDGAGSGIASYNVFVSTNAGPFQPFQTGTTATSATFTGQVGDTYAFFSVATSNVGLVQRTPTAAQATTKVVKVTVPPPAIVTSVEWGTIQVKTGSGKKAKTKSEPALEITFSEPVSGAANPGAYELFSVTTKTVKKKPVTTLKPIGLSSIMAASSPRTTSVKLVPSSKVNVSQTTELEIIAADVTDAEGRALDGNDDGKPGANFVGKFGGGGLTFARPSAIVGAGRLPAAAVDAVLERILIRRGAR
ncbi:MAG: carboxypeptidase regulatory-like domain-containing protein [Isosphaeraceae bacterium]